jgi:hypothetical protein
LTEIMTAAEFNARRRMPRGRGKLGGHTPGKMNGLEKAWAEQLQGRLGLGLLWWAFEAVTFRLGHDCRYTPDFVWMASSGEIVFDDTKGGLIAPEGRTKIAVAAGLFPFRFRIIQRRPKKEGGGWTIKEINAGDDPLPDSLAPNRPTAPVPAAPDGGRSGDLPPPG